MIKLVQVSLLIGAIIFALSMAFDHDPETDMRVAWNAYQAGDMDSALRLARLAALMSSQESRMWQASHELQARAALKLHNRQYARNVVDDLLAVHPDHRGGLQLRGTIKLDTGDAQGALVDLQRIRLQPIEGDARPSRAQAEILAERAQAFLQVGDIDAAYADAHAAYKANPSNWNTQYAMSLVLEEKGQLQQALQFLEMALRNRNRAQPGFFLGPEDKEWTYRLVTLRAKIKKLDNPG